MLMMHRRGLGNRDEVGQKVCFGKIHKPKNDTLEGIYTPEIYIAGRKDTPVTVLYYSRLQKKIRVYANFAIHQVLVD